MEVSSAPAGTAGPAAADRTAASSAPRDWLSLGLNCGGAVLAWIGVVGTGALAPVTSGTRLYGAAFLWGGAVAASGQCGVSVYRVGNIYTGREDVNAALDASPTYNWTMRAADGFAIIGAGGALKEFVQMRRILKSETLSVYRGATGPISRPMRKRLSQDLGLIGAKRVSASSINQLVKQRMLDALRAVIGLTGSAATGVIREINVWIVSEAEYNL